jgi:hypothetical protein
MIVYSKLRFGYRPGSRPLINKGRNDIDESSLTHSERRFLSEAIRCKILTLGADPEPAPLADIVVADSTVLAPSEPPREPRELAFETVTQLVPVTEARKTRGRR